MKAAAHPGRLGDLIYCLPTLRYNYGLNGEKFDVFTSEYCLPAKRLFEYQPYINSFQVSKDYKLDNWGRGGQPYYVPIPNESRYTEVLQLGFKRIPDTALHQFIAKEQGYNIPLAIRYEPFIESEYLRSIEFKSDGTVRYVYQSVTLNSPYICIAPRGKTSFEDTFNELADKTNAVIIGGKNEYTGHGIDMTGIDMLDTLSILSQASAFVGLMSSQLVLANGFDVKRIAIHDGKSWDMRHVVYTPWNYYPVNPTVDELLDILDK